MAADFFVLNVSEGFLSRGSTHHGRSTARLPARLKRTARILSGQPNDGWPGAVISLG
jgi:hypothetical protein